jgi:hypothetical protein
LRLGRRLSFTSLIVLVHNIDADTDKALLPDRPGTTCSATLKTSSPPTPLLCFIWQCLAGHPQWVCASIPLAPSRSACPRRPSMIEDGVSFRSVPYLPPLQHRTLRPLEVDPPLSATAVSICKDRHNQFLHFTKIRSTSITRKGILSFRLVERSTTSQSISSSALDFRDLASTPSLCPRSVH